MRIRRAEINDAHAFAALTRSEIETGLPHTWTAARLRRVLGSPNTNAYALIPIDCDGVCGFSVASFETERAHLLLHAIAPGLHRRGLGRELLNWQIEAAVTAGLTLMRLEVRASNVSARHFYAARGFEATCRMSKYYNGEEDAVSMQLTPLASNGTPPPPPFARPDNTDSTR